jgi:hypothetical protein
LAEFGTGRDRRGVADPLAVAVPAALDAEGSGAGVADVSTADAGSGRGAAIGADSAGETAAAWYVDGRKSITATAVAAAPPTSA